MILSAPIYVLKRRAKQLVRAQHVPHARALDLVAREEGFENWSRLAAADAATGRAARVLSRLRRGALVLLAARPEHGKTTLGLEVLREASLRGRAAYFFTLEYTEAEVHARLSALAGNEDARNIEVDTSDALCADYVTGRLCGAQTGTVVVIDYMQLLDQRRETPPLPRQLTALKAFAAARDVTVICISQIDRAYDASKQRLPGMSDVRLPNPVDLGLFDQSIFLGEGQLRLRDAA